MSHRQTRKRRKRKVPEILHAIGKRKFKLEEAALFVLIAHDVLRLGGKPPSITWGQVSPADRGISIELGWNHARKWRALIEALARVAPVVLTTVPNAKVQGAIEAKRQLNLLKLQRLFYDFWRDLIPVSDLRISALHHAFLQTGKVPVPDTFARGLAMAYPEKDF